jgi:hypothetical protein
LHGGATKEKLKPSHKGGDYHPYTFYKVFHKGEKHTPSVASLLPLPQALVTMR